jgi:long-chain acyl-CoA synthetase
MEQLGLQPDCSLQELAQHPQVQEWVQMDIDAVNQELAQFETIKKFKIIPEEFTTGNFMTPSLKIKRKVVTERFKSEIEAMYQ